MPSRISSRSIFQSPLHRGGLFNQAFYFYSLYGDVFQSPLHRGGLFNAGLEGPYAGAGAFQSPLHRGGLFNSAVPWTWISFRPISVPSSSGRSLQPGRTHPAQPDPIISVPSSSGRSLQRLRRWWWMRTRSYFSPLFIGEVSSTALFAPYFQQDTGLPSRNSSKTPNSLEMPGGLRKSTTPDGRPYLSQALPPL